VERHSNVLRHLEVVSRIMRRVKGEGKGGLLSEAEKTSLNTACSMFGVAWKQGYPGRLLTPKGHIVVAHVPMFVELWGICGVFGEDGAEALHVTDMVCRRMVRTMRNPEERHRAHSLHHLSMVCTPAINRAVDSR
jgi:hypothetical protein